MSSLSGESDGAGEVQTQFEDGLHSFGEVQPEHGKLDLPSSSDADLQGLQPNGHAHRSASSAQRASSSPSRGPIAVAPQGTMELEESELSGLDDSPSIHDSLPSSPGSGASVSAPRGISSSPTPSLQPFDRRFKARLSSSSIIPRGVSPAFLSSHSRQSSLSSQILQEQGDTETPPNPWEIVRWTKLSKLSSQIFSEAGRRNFGRPTCISASAYIGLGTSKGVILVVDYRQSIKSILGPGTKAVEAGPVTSLAISADYSTIAGGHNDGSIFTWDVARPANPFLHVPPLSNIEVQARKDDGHISRSAVTHVGFLGTRHTALVSADDHGMAFSHLATRGLGAVSRSIKTTRVLGRYPESNSASAKNRRPSTVLAFSALPLGNAEQTTDTMGLVAMLTPYLLVVVSTTPVAQTQHKGGRPREVASHIPLSGCLAWFPSVKLKVKDETTGSHTSMPKLVYCWSNILTVLEVREDEPSEPSSADRPPNLVFKPRSRWRASESIVAVQWISRSVIGILTITQQLVILEDKTMRVTEKFDLLQKHIFHRDLFSSQLQALVEPFDESEPSMHSVVADAFYGSFRVYKGRIFLLGVNDLSIGTLSNWADRLVALMEDGNYIGALELATEYYNGTADRVTVGLPEDDQLRHNLVAEKLFQMITASLQYFFRQGPQGISEGKKESFDQSTLPVLTSCLFSACLAMGAREFLYEDVYPFYEDNGVQKPFFDVLEIHIRNLDISSLPPTLLKSMVEHLTSLRSHALLEEIICHLNTDTMDFDQITALCKEHQLYAAFIYVWNRGLNDFTTPLVELLGLVCTPSQDTIKNDSLKSSSRISSLSALFPYLAYSLTSRIYPTGEVMDEEMSLRAKSELYFVLFSGKTITWPQPYGGPFLVFPTEAQPTFPYLRFILNLDAPSFLSALNEAFEDPYLNNSSDRVRNGSVMNGMSEEQVFGLSIDRQYIINILLDIMNLNEYAPEDIVYLNMFLARNLPKFPQFILLSGTTLHRTLVGLCDYPSSDIAKDCELSVETLLSVYHPSDMNSLIPLFRRAKFYRILKSIYKADGLYTRLIEICFEDSEGQDLIFDCIEECMHSNSDQSKRQQEEVKGIVIAHAYELICFDLGKTAKVLDHVAPELHEKVLNAIQDDISSQFQYLRQILEPNINGPESHKINQRLSSDLVEMYIRLMCKFDPSHVATFICFIPSGNLRVDELLPALEHEDIVDATVKLLTQDGKTQEAMQRLVKHLQTLETSLLGLLARTNHVQDIETVPLSTDIVLEELRKYVTVGIWLCQQQMQIAMAHETIKSPANLDTNMTGEELLWVDLISSVVQLTRNTKSDLQSLTEESTDGIGFDQTIEPIDATDQSSSSPSALSEHAIVASLRSNVQDVFTALLAATSTSSTSSRTRVSSPNNRRGVQPVSFLRVLRAFLTRASQSSPSLSDLHGVLSSIFSAYAYEESLLSMANKLLESDLFIHVEDVNKRRRQGWRPFGQICEGCRKRIWGPGAGAGIWEAWKARMQRGPRRNFEHSFRGGNTTHPSRLDPSDIGDARAKGKVVSSRSSSLDDGKDRAPEGVATDPSASGAPEDNDLDSTIVFSCRHIFHRSCLQKLMQRSEGSEQSDPIDARHLTCVVCA